jgi:hypothetical protein
MSKPSAKSAASAGDLTDAILTATTPVVLRGLASSWPMVRAARNPTAPAATTCAASTRRHHRRHAGRAGAGGRFFYNHDLSGFNFQPVHAKLTGVLDEIEAKSQMNPAPTVYVGSTSIDTCLPGFRQFNDLAGGARRAGQHLDRQPHPHRRPLRPAGQCGGGGGRPSPLHPVPAGAAEEPVRRPGRLHAGRPGHQPGGLPASGLREIPRFAEALQHAQWPNWDRATPCSSPACGGTTSKRWTPSTC